MGEEVKAIIQATLHKDPGADEGYMRVWIPEQYRGVLHRYAVEHGPGPHRVAIEQLAGPMVRAKHLFFAIVDRLAKAGGDSSRQNKDQIKEALKIDYGARVGEELKSLADGAEPPYDMTELRVLIQGSILECLEQKVDVEDLAAEKNSLEEKDANRKSEASQED